MNISQGNISEINNEQIQEVFVFSEAYRSLLVISCCCGLFDPPKKKKKPACLNEAKLEQGNHSHLIIPQICATDSVCMVARFARASTLDSSIQVCFRLLFQFQIRSYPFFHMGN